MDPQVKDALLNIIHACYKRFYNQLAPGSMLHRTHELNEMVENKQIDDHVEPIIVKLQINIIKEETRILYEGVKVEDFQDVLDYINDFLSNFEDKPETKPQPENTEPETT